MSPAGFKKSSVAGVGLAALGLAVGAMVLAAMLAQPNAPLQRIADDAAAAGVNALAESAGQPGEQRIRDSVAAAQGALAGRPGTLRSLSGSAEALTLSVMLVDAHGAEATAQAIYQMPSEGVAAQNSAALPSSLLAPGDRARM